MTTPLPATAQQQLVQVAGFEGFFGTKEGGEVAGDVTKTKDGGSLVDLIIPGGTPSTSNVTVTKLYRPAVHAAELKRLAKRVLRERTTLNIYDSDPDLGPIGDPVTYADALLVRVKRPDHDANSSDPAYFELEYAVSEES